MLRRFLPQEVRRVAAVARFPTATQRSAPFAALRWQAAATTAGAASKAAAESASEAAAKFSKPVESKKFGDPDMTHFRVSPTKHPLYDKKKVPAEWDNQMAHTIWTEGEMNAVAQTHLPVKDLTDRVALGGIKVLRRIFDLVSGYAFGNLTVNKILRRILFLECAAGIPGMVAGSIRHLRSLRLMRRDRGWIHTLLEEAENERMHMLVFMHTYKPGLVFRGAVLLTQGIFWNIFFLCYLVSPRLCHRFVGYLEEEAVRTYTHIIEVMDSENPRDAEVRKYGKSPATEVAKYYWRLKPDATMRDVILAVRADEANHRDVNHTLAGIGKFDQCPFDENGHKH